MKVTVYYPSVVKKEIEISDKFHEISLEDEEILQAIAEKIGVDLDAEDIYGIFDENGECLYEG